MSERDLPLDSSLGGDSRPEWPIRLWKWITVAWRPDLGWSVLLCCMALTVLPPMLLWQNQWLRYESLFNRLSLLGPLALAVAWLLGGWRNPWTWRPAWLRRIVQVLGYALIGLLVVSQLLGDWVPGPGDWWLAVRSGNWQPLWLQTAAAFQQTAGRFGLWWTGVQENNAARDDIVLAGIAALGIWLLAGLMAVLARRYRSGLLAGLPILWPMGFIMLYSPADRWLFVAAVGLTLVLHLLLDQQKLVRRWQALGLDYSPSLLIERGALAGAGLILALALASLMPNLYIYEVTARYYEWLTPVNDQMEALGKRLFPGLNGIAPWQGRGVAGGLPNAFLLNSGGDLGSREVMRVRTDEPVSGYNQPPLGHPLRGATFADYNSRGWTNPDKIPLAVEHAANQPWAQLTTGRRPLLQSVNLDFNSTVVYAAGEPEAPSVDYVARQHFAGDLEALTARTRSYTVVSQVPALDEKQLAEMPAWGKDNPLPAEYNIYLTLPVSVTQRTRDLAAQVTAGETTMYGEASALEKYLRTIPYDLEVKLPDQGVADVADYFLFDLKRGYCDYYATAFVVMARSLGLPSRFATGFAPGYWSMTEGLWIITEAEAHSWPEVYFPQVGWVRFEPTAYRPLPERIGLPASGSASGDQSTFKPLEPPPTPSPWLYLWWTFLVVGPVALISWVALRWRAGREDPWLGLLRWGRRVGRPAAAGDTPLEYGAALAEFVEEKHAQAAETSRSAAREVRALSQDVSAVRYAPVAERAAVQKQAVERWSRLRELLRRLR